MGNIVEREDSLGEESSDEEFTRDTLDRGFTYRSGSRAQMFKPSPDRPAVLKRGESRSIMVSRAVSSRRRPSFKATRRSPSRTSLFKSRMGNTFQLADMEVQVSNGNIAKLVPRDSILRKSGMAPIRPKMEPTRERKSRKTGKRVKIKDSMKLTSAQLLRPGLEIIRKLSYDTAIANNTTYDVESRSAAGKTEPTSPTESVSLRHMIEFKPAYSESKRWTHADSPTEKPIIPITRPKSADVNSNNNNTSGIKGVVASSDSRQTSGEKVRKELLGKFEKLSVAASMATS